MGGRSSLKSNCLVFLVALSLAIVEPSEAFRLESWQIHMVNGLSNGQILFAHCKSSGDDDLGVRNLISGTEFNWSFNVNLWDTTLFWCYLRKPNAQTVSFDAFWIENRSVWLFYHCYKFNCIWTAKDDGVYLRRNTIGFDILIHEWTDLHKNNRNNTKS